MKKVIKKIGEYYLDIYYPTVIAEGTKLPILYVLDGDAFALTISEAVKLQTRNSKKTGVKPMVIVGIGYHNSSPFDREKDLLILHHLKSTRIILLTSGLVCLKVEESIVS
ncbi:hypothetical protein OBG91_13890 [Lactococcus lactis]|nr:hypothetical protein [Lactococcus lactis]